MERRDFIEKLAKAAAGIALAPETVIEEAMGNIGRKFPLPRVVRVYDETVFPRGKIDGTVFEMMVVEGLKALYHDIAGDDLFATLFPGIDDDSNIGFKVAHSGRLDDESSMFVAGVINGLKSLPRKSPSAGEKNIVWLPRREDLEERGVKNDSSSYAGDIQFGDDTPFDDEADSPVEVDEHKMTAFPLLSRLCHFQVGIVVDDVKKGGNRCRDNYLECFRCEGHDDWPHGFSEEERQSTYERLCYPLGMKFRLHFVDRLAYDNSLIMGGDPVWVDEYLIGADEMEKAEKYTLVEINNPSAPEIDSVSVIRSGEDLVVNWESPDYEGRFQVYRDDNPDYYPCRERLIAITSRRSFRDYEAYRYGPFYYRVTKEWGI